MSRAPFADEPPRERQSPQVDLARLRSDLEGHAAAAGVRFDSRVVDQLLDTFGDVYARSAIGVRTTTESPATRTVNFRYMTPDVAHDPVARLVEAGIVTPANGPVETLTSQIVDRFPLWWGLDASVEHGFQKLWTFFERTVPLQEILSLPGMPSSTRKAGEMLADSGLDRVLLLALDYTNMSVNLYAPLTTDGRFTPSRVARMIADSGFEVPGPDQLEECAELFHFYYTFDWTSPDVRRLSFAMLATSDTFPAHLDPVATRFVAEAPSLDPDRHLVWNHTYGPHGHYLKTDMDYTGTIGSTILPYWSR